MKTRKLKTIQQIKREGVTVQVVPGLSGAEIRARKLEEAAKLIRSTDRIATRDFNDQVDVHRKVGADLLKLTAQLFSDVLLEDEYASRLLEFLYHRSLAECDRND